MAKKKQAVENKLKVNIRARQKISYDQTVEMTQEEWDHLKGMDPETIAQMLSEGSWLDLAQIDDREPIEEKDFDLYVMDGTKVVEEYTWDSKDEEEQDNEG